jgi:hypothetical protein
MTKKTDPFDDLNLDDLNGDKKNSLIPSTTQVAEEAIVAAIQYIDDNAIPLTEEEIWRQCLARLDRHVQKKGQTGDETICLPIVDNNGKFFLAIRTLQECTGSEFLAWLNYIYPPSKTQGFKTEECDEYKYRESLYLNVIQTHDFFKFPKTRGITEK